MKKLNRSACLSSAIAGLLLGASSCSPIEAGSEVEAGSEIEAKTYSFDKSDRRGLPGSEKANCAGRCAGRCAGGGNKAAVKK